MPPELPETIGPYRVQELLGRAGQSAVFKALDRRGRPVAVKLFPARLSEDPAMVGRLASAYIRGMQGAGVSATLKHFPGHGDTHTDSHRSLPVLDVSRERLEKTFVVF